MEIIANAHKHRHRVNGNPCSASCIYCFHPVNVKPKNKTGHRHNPAAKRSGRRNPERKVVIDAGRSLLDQYRAPRGPKGLGSI